MNEVQYVGRAPVMGTGWIAPIPAPVRNSRIRRKTHPSRSPSLKHTLPSADTIEQIKLSTNGQMDKWREGKAERQRNQCRCRGVWIYVINAFM